MSSYENPPKPKSQVDTTDGLTPVQRAKAAREAAAVTLADSKNRMPIATAYEENSAINHRVETNEAAAIAAEEVIREAAKRRESARREAELAARSRVEMEESKIEWRKWMDGLIAEASVDDAQFVSGLENIQAGNDTHRAEQSKKKADPLADFDIPTQDVDVSEAKAVETSFDDVPDGFIELSSEGDLETGDNDYTISESDAPASEVTDESMTVSASVLDTTPGRQRFNRALTKEEVKKILEQTATDPRYREATNPRVPKKISTADVSSVASTAQTELPPTELIPAVVDPKKPTPATEKKAPSRIRGWLKKIGLLFGIATALDSAVQQPQEYSTASADVENATTIMVDDKGVQEVEQVADVDSVAEVAQSSSNEQAPETNLVRTNIETGEGVSQAMLRLGYDISDIQAALQLPVTIGSETKTLGDVFVDAKGGDLGMTITENPEGGVASVDFYSVDGDKTLMPAAELSSVLHFVGSSEAVPQTQEPATTVAPQASEPMMITAPATTAVVDRAPVQGTSVAVTPDIPPAPVIKSADAPMLDPKLREAVIVKKPEDNPNDDEQQVDTPAQIKMDGPDRRSFMNPERQLSGLEDILDQMAPGTELYYSPLVFRIPEEEGEVQIRHIADAQHYYKVTPLLLETLGFDYRKDYEDKRLSRASFRDIVAGQGLDPIPR